MSDIVIQSLVIIVPIGALVLGLYYFQSRQMIAMETRLRGDMRDSETRLREDMRDLETRLRGEITAVAQTVETAKSELRGEITAVAQSVEMAKSELRGEIAAVARLVEKGDSNLGHRLDRMDDKISRLIQDVGVVQGAVLGVSVEAGTREPAVTD